MLTSKKDKLLGLFPKNHVIYTGFKSRYLKYSLKTKDMKTRFKILFFHGFFASGHCALADTLREALHPLADVAAPDLPLHPKTALQQMHAYCEKERPDLLVGNSCGYC